MNIRLATLDDIPALQELIPASVRALSIGYYSEQQIASALKYVFGVDTQLILDGTYFIVAEGGQIVGAGGWSKRQTLFGGDQHKQKQPDQLLNPETQPARIRAFYVHPQWARRGIGRMILKACEAAAKDAGFTKLELMATLPGEPLYSRMGYTRIESSEMTMPGGESISGYLMRKDL